MINPKKVAIEYMRIMHGHASRSRTISNVLGMLLHKQLQVQHLQHLQHLQQAQQGNLLRLDMKGGFVHRDIL